MATTTKPGECSYLHRPEKEKRTRMKYKLCNSWQKWYRLLIGSYGGIDFSRCLERDILARLLTNSPLWYMEDILEVYSAHSFYELVSCVPPRTAVFFECHSITLITNQYCLGKPLVPSDNKSLPKTDPCRHVVSLGHSGRFAGTKKTVLLPEN